MKTILTAFLMALSATGTVSAQQATGPTLAVASRFGQAWHGDILTAARQLPVMDFRDEVYWSRIEGRTGKFAYRGPMVTFPDRMQEQGARVSIILNPRHPRHDHGDTAHTKPAVTAFGRMAASLVERFANIGSVEVGNEFNGPDFVSGTVLEQGLGPRPGFYLPLLRSVYRSVKGQNPDVAVLGGATLGIPDGYLERLFDLGAGEYMDALAIHPYTTPAEHLARQIAVLRRVPGIAAMPIEVTEFGSTDLDRAAGKLLKGYCQFALSGVTRLVWYPLADRGDGLVPLLDATGGLTPVGQAYRLIQRELAGRRVSDASPDPYTYACRFDDRRMILWGEPRKMHLSDGVGAFGPTGGHLAGDDLTLSMDRPIILKSDKPLIFGENIRLDPQSILADSYHDLAFPNGAGGFAPGDRFERFSRRGGQEVPMVSVPGQSGPAMPWTPFLGDPGDGYVRLSETYLRPDGTAAAPVEVVHRYISGRAGPLYLSGYFDPSPDSEDGVRVRILSAGEVVFDRSFRARTEIDGLELAPGIRGAIEVSVGPNVNASGDLTRFRLTIRDRPDP